MSVYGCVRTPASSGGGRMHCLKCAGTKAKTQVTVLLRGHCCCASDTRTHKVRLCGKIVCSPDEVCAALHESLCCTLLR